MDALYKLQYGYRGSVSINIFFPTVIPVFNSGQRAILSIYQYMMAVSKAVPDGQYIMAVPDGEAVRGEQALLGYPSGYLFWTTPTDGPATTKSFDTLNALR